MSEALQPSLIAMGHDVRLGRQSSKVNTVQKVEGNWVGAADPRSDGVALTQPSPSE